MAKNIIYKAITMLLITLIVITMTYCDDSSKNNKANEDEDTYVDYVAIMEKRIDQEAKGLKTFEQRINALYSKSGDTRSAGIWSLIDNPDPKAIPHIMQLLKDQKRHAGTLCNKKHLSMSLDVFMSIGTPVIPYIVDEFKTILKQVPNEDQLFVEILENTLSELTSQSRRYWEMGTAAEKRGALQWWIDWWDKHKSLSQISWRKESIRSLQRDLSVPNSIRAETIKLLRGLTGQKFSEVIANTPPNEYPDLKDRKAKGDFTGYPNEDDLKKWQDWFDKYGEIDKWNQWIDENYDYLYWTKDKGYFIINEEAKKKKVPIDPETGKMIK